MKIEKKLTFQSVFEDFETKYSSTFYNTERNIVELLLFESETFISKIQVEIQEEVHEKNWENLRESMLS